MKRGGTSRAISRNRSHSGWSPVWLMTARAPITNKYSPDRAGLLHYVLISDEHRPRVFPASAAADPRWVSAVKTGPLLFPPCYATTPSCTLLIPSPLPFSPLLLICYKRYILSIHEESKRQIFFVSQLKESRLV